MILTLKTTTKYLFVGISALILTGTAHAGTTCSSMQKELGLMGKEIVSMQADRDEVVAIFETHNDERASFRNELANAKTGVIKFTREEKEELATQINFHDEEAEAAKLKLEAFNNSLIEKGATYNEISTRFNTKCVG